MGCSCYSSQQEKDIHIQTDSSKKRPTMGIHWCLGFVELVFVMFDFPPLVVLGESTIMGNE
jgi:hypothetical protein